MGHHGGLRGYLAVRSVEAQIVIGCHGHPQCALVAEHTVLQQVKSIILLLIACKLTFKYDQMRVESKIPKNYKQNAIRKTIYLI